MEPNDFDPRSTLASGEALSKMNVGEAYEIELLARDRFGNERGSQYAPQDAFTIVADLREGADFIQIHQTAVTGASYYDESRQRHVLPLQINLAGEYAMDVVGLDPETGQQVPIFGGHSFGVDSRPGHTDPQECVVWGDAVLVRELNTGVVNAGVPAMFELESRDAMSNKLRETGDEFEIVLLHSETSHAVRGHAVGSQEHAAEYEIRFVPEISGSSLLSLRCASCSGAGHILGSPFPIFVFPGPPDASKCTAHGDAVSRAVEAVSGTFQVYVRDMHSNHLLDYGEFPQDRWYNVSTLDLNLTVQISSTGLAESIEYVGNGTFDVTYVARGSGTQSMDVMIDGMHIYGSPFTLNILDGETIADLSQASFQGTTRAIASVRRRSVSFFSTSHVTAFSLFPVSLFPFHLSVILIFLSFSSRYLHHFDFDWQTEATTREQRVENWQRTQYEIIRFAFTKSWSRLFKSRLEMCFKTTTSR